MADNTTLNPGSGGAVIATDDIGSGVQVQRVKVGFGPDGSLTDVSATTPLPVVPATSGTASSVFTFTSTTSATLLASNASRKGMALTNEGAGTLNILFGSGTASTTNYSVAVPAGGYWECPFGFTGQLTAIFTAAGTARGQELT